MGYDDNSSSTSGNYQGKVRGRRKAPYPNSILDRKALTEALEEAGISIRPLHIDAFYQALHRQQYPPLAKFVETYHANERKECLQQQETAPELPEKGQDGTEKTPMEEQTGQYGSENANTANYAQPRRKEQQQQQHLPFPLKNAVTNRKNRNKVQLPRTLLEYVSTTPDFVHETSRVKERLTSHDGSTTKLIVELHDGSVVESVLMRYEKKGPGRASLCVSSQCGCAMGCTFCATGTMGLSGNLTAGEILEQLVHADRILAEEFLARRQQQQQLQGRSEQRQQQEQRQKEKVRQRLSAVDEEGRDGDDGISGSSSSAAGPALPGEAGVGKRIDVVRNVVFMGMGEPLDNYANVTEACRAMIDRGRWNLAHGRVTVSTVGLISQIRRLTRELPEVSLALSLHAPNQRARTAIVPTAARYPIEGLIDALDNHMMAYLEKRRERADRRGPTDGLGTNDNDDAAARYTAEERIRESSRRRAMIEYVMLEGETSSLECAHQLGRLCEGRHLVVNLIPYNATDVQDRLQCPPAARLDEFKRIVQSYGTFCTIRRTMGADIASACGQLVQKDRPPPNGAEDGAAGQAGQETAGRPAIRDIEDVVQKDRSGSVERREGHPAPTGQGRDATSPPAAAGTEDGNATEGKVRDERKPEGDGGMPSLIHSLSADDLDRWAAVLAVATTVSAAFFVASSFLYLKRKA